MGRGQRHGKWGAPTITNDGVSIAKEIELEDPWEKIGAELVKEVAKKTDDVAGDGTTTATVLAQALVREGLRNVAAGANPIAVKRGIEQAVEAVAGHVLKSATELETKQQIAATASISAGDRTIGELIAEAMDKVGRDGVITVEESNTLGMELELAEGYALRQGVHLRLLRDRPRASGSGPRRALHPVAPRQDQFGQRLASIAGEGHAGRQAAADQRRSRRRSRGGQGQNAPVRSWPQRADRRIRGPAGGGHHRPGQGHPLGAAERSLDRRRCS